MQDKNLDYFKKGNYEEIKTNFITDGITALSHVAAFQRKYEKADNDSVINELHDAIVGRHLGFKYVNTNKHGLDCKYDKDIDIFLESKVASLSADSISATFNDTTLEKAEVFKDKKTWLALSVWATESELSFICFGQNEKIGEYLEEKVKTQTQKSQRRTQTISLKELIFTYNFKILPIGQTSGEVITLLTSKSTRSYGGIKNSDFISYEQIRILNNENEDNVVTNNAGEENKM